MTSPEEQLEELWDQECIRLLKSNDIGRVGLIDEWHKPLIFPVNYFFDEDAVIFRTGKGSKLELAPGTYVCFEIDGWDPDEGIGWSVLVKGIAHDITQPPGMPSGRLHFWPVRPLAPGARDHWIGVWANEITGRRFQTRAHRGGQK